MSTSPSKPHISGSLPEPKQPQWFESFPIRVVLYIAGSVICVVLLALTANTSQTQSPLLIILFSSVPAVVLGIVFAIIQNFDDRTRSLEKHVRAQEGLMKRYSEEIEKLSTQDHVNAYTIEQLTGDFRLLLHNTGEILQFYGTIRSILDDGYQQKTLLRTFLKKAMNGPLFIQPMEERDFFDLAVDGIRECSTWQVIHQGSIRELHSFSYLQQMRTTENFTIEKLTKKQRIVILTKEEAKELRVHEIVSEFLKTTEGTESYWIDKDVFFKSFDIPPKMRLDDAALHDGQLLILRQRETKLVMLALLSHKDRACNGIIRAFTELNLHLALKKLESSPFKKITLPDSHP